MGIERIGVSFAKSANKISADFKQVVNRVKADFSTPNITANKFVEQFQVRRRRLIRRNVDRYLLESTAQNFQSSKQKLLDLLTGKVDKSFFERLSKSKDSVHMDIIISLELKRLEKDFIRTFNLSQKLNGNKFTLELEQECYKFLNARENLILAREKAFYVKSVNPKVVKIENILKEKYGVKYVSLKDNENMAQLILKSFEIAKKNNKSIPENVFVSDFFSLQGEYLQNSKSVIYVSDKINEIVKLSSQETAKQFPDEQVKILQEIFFKRQRHIYSTNSPEHVILHEILHAEHPQLLAYKLQKIPSNFISTKKLIGEYSAKSKAHETFVELNTKRCLQGLNEQEEELYNYLNFYA